MALNYALFENPMTSDLNDRMAVTQVNETFTLENVFEEITRQGSTVTTAEGLAVFEEFSRALEKLLRNGNSIVTPLFNLTFSITGTFDGDDDSFDPARHQVKLRINPGVRLREIENQIAVSKINAEKRAPVLAHFHDASSESQDTVITPNGGIRITGTMLKFDETDENQGIFFVNMANGTAIKVGTQLLRNKPGELIFIAPALAAGTYRVEVRALLNNNKELRTGALASALTVS